MAAAGLGGVPARTSETLNYMIAYLKFLPASPTLPQLNHTIKSHLALPETTPALAGASPLQ
jgi:hypothetical protein